MATGINKAKTGQRRRPSAEKMAGAQNVRARLQARPDESLATPP